MRQETRSIAQTGDFKNLKMLKKRNRDLSQPIISEKFERREKNFAFLFTTERGSKNLAGEVFWFHSTSNSKFRSKTGEQEKAIIIINY